MSPDGNIQYDFIKETAHSDIEHLLVAAVNQCTVIEGKKSSSFKEFLLTHFH